MSREICYKSFKQYLEYQQIKIKCCRGCLAIKNTEFQLFCGILNLISEYYNFVGCSCNMMLYNKLHQLVYCLGRQRHCQQKSIKDLEIICEVVKFLQHTTNFAEIKLFKKKDFTPYNQNQTTLISMGNFKTVTR